MLPAATLTEVELALTRGELLLALLRRPGSMRRTWKEASGRKPSSSRCRRLPASGLGSPARGWQSCIAQGLLGPGGGRSSGVAVLARVHVDVGDMGTTVFELRACSLTVRLQAAGLL